MINKSNKFLGILSKNVLLYQNFSRSYKVGVIGAPWWNGQKKMGTELGPDTLRAYGLLKRLIAIQKDVVDFGNLNFDLQNSATPDQLIDSSVQLSSKNEFLASQMNRTLSSYVQSLVSKGYVSLVLGGDHSIAAGSVIGTCGAKKQLGADISLIWIDAHADANTESTSHSGNFHGMPITFLLKNIQTPQRTLFQNIKPCLDAKNVAFIGLRDVEIQELRLLKDLNIAYYSMRDVDRLGIHEVTNRALDAVNPHNQNKLHVSFDVDSVDNNMIPSTGTPVLGGFTVREACCIGEIISQTGQMVALDVVEFNPKIGTIDQVEQSANCTNNIVLSFFGKSRLGYYNVNIEN